MPKAPSEKTLPMRRRRFHHATWRRGSLAARARAQQPAMPVIGFLRSTPAEPFAEYHGGVPPRPERDGVRRKAERGGRPNGWADISSNRLPGLAGRCWSAAMAVIVGNGQRWRRPGAPLRHSNVFVIGDESGDAGP